jgi:hypothetical protein
MLIREQQIKRKEREMSKFTGTAAGIDEHGARELLPAKTARSMCKFKLAVNPNSWRWDDLRGKCVPEFLRIPLDPGIQNTVIRHINGRPVMSTAGCENDFTSKGHILLSYSDARLKDVLNSGYMKRWDTNGKRQTYSFAWESPTVFMGNVNWEVDYDMLAAVQDALAERILPPMDSRLIALHLGRVSKRLSRIKGPEHPLRDRLLARQEGMLAVLEEIGDERALRQVARYVRRTTQNDRNAAASQKRTRKSPAKKS